MKYGVIACLPLAIGISFNVMASDIYNCIYSKASLDNGKMGQMIGADQAKVEYDGSYFKAYRPGGMALVSPKLNVKNGTVTLANDGIKVFAVSNDHKTFAISDRIGKTTEQWDKCSAEEKDAIKGGVKDPLLELQEVERMSSSRAKSYFLKEKHAFTTNCLVWNDVTMITGDLPAMIIAGSLDIGKNPRWDGKEYSFSFNGGSMIARFTPSEPRHKLLIQAGDKFYGCGPSEIDHNYD